MAIEVYPDLILEKDGGVFGAVSRLREHVIKCIIFGYATECLEGNDN